MGACFLEGYGIGEDGFLDQIADNLVTFLTLIGGAALGCLISGIILLLLLKRGWSDFALDTPTMRSLHSVPVPRTGGIAIVVTVLVTLAFCRLEALFVSVLSIALVSLWDDVKSLGTKVRLLIQVIAAGWFLYIVSPPESYFYTALYLFTLVWGLNLFNFMDGSDGLAGGMTAIGFGAYMVSFSWAETHEWAVLSAVLVGSAGSFLKFNFSPAKIYMGDSGSVSIGFLAGAAGIVGTQQSLWPFWFPVIVFSPFIVDATATLIKRGVRGEKIWQAHRSHYYQRVILMGWSHTRLALSEYALMFVCAGAALLALRNPGTRALIFSGLALLYIALMTIVDYHWSKHLRKAGAHV